MIKEAVCIIVQNKEGLFLAVSRKDDPTAFGLPGGKIDGMELPLTAIIREVKEETGYDVDKVYYIFQEICEGEVDYLCYGFIGKVNTSVAPAKTAYAETGVVKWVTREELETGPFGTYNQNFFKKYFNVKY
jgi:8-oxo-dGTP pyrophosphatase MutT (NUDIX family)